MQINYCFSINKFPEDFLSTIDIDIDIDIYIDIKIIMLVVLDPKVRIWERKSL
jgi:hypothetical protein